VLAVLLRSASRFFVGERSPHIRLTGTVDTLSQNAFVDDAMSVLRVASVQVRKAISSA
jgi:hypothetical protein